MNKYTFFYQNRTPFSNWYPSNFVYGDIMYCCGEQYMMHRKALLFKDAVAAKCIMDTKVPKEHQSLGRIVQNYVDSKWADVRYEVMAAGLYCKFDQNPKLKAALLNTGNTIMAEASPYDKIWGIGMAATDSGVENQNNWKGQNLSGKVLMEVREVLQSELVLSD